MILDQYFVMFYLLPLDSFCYYLRKNVMRTYYIMFVSYNAKSI